MKIYRQIEPIVSPLFPLSPSPSRQKKLIFFKCGCHLAAFTKLLRARLGVSRVYKSHVIDRRRLEHMCLVFFSE